MNRREALRCLAYTGATVSNLGAVSAFLGSCAKRQFTRSPLREDRYGVTLLLDGWRADMFQEMLDAGVLPNIKKHLVDRGTMVETCVSTFPSTTGPAHLPFITGVMPGYNNCPGLRWVDRSARKIRDYCTLQNVLFNDDFPRPNYTIYEILYDQRTLCVFDFVSRGASDIFSVPASNLWWMAMGDTDVWRRLDGEAVNRFQKTFDGGGVPPRFSFVWMPGIDHLCHVYGTKHEIIYEKALDVDKQVGRVAETLQKHRLYDKTLIAMVVDHGLRDTAQHMDIKGVMDGYGLNVLDSLTEKDNFSSLYQNNAVRAVSGNSFGCLYFAGQKSGRLGTMSYDWERPIEYDELRSFNVGGKDKIDLVDLLRNEKGMGVVIAKERDDVILVFSRDGEGRIERDFSSFKYSVTGNDPLGYSSEPESAALINDQFHDKDAWFTATRKTNYPDGLFQLAQLFDSGRCGDIVVNAESGWDLMNEVHKASHGSPERGEIQVPCILAGPGMKQGTIPIARTVDVHPTFLRYFGIPHYDGEVLDVFA